MVNSFIHLVFRNPKSRNRPSFNQVLRHLEIAGADLLASPQERYFKSQVSLQFFYSVANESFQYNLLLNLFYRSHGEKRSQHTLRKSNAKALKFIS